MCKNIVPALKWRIVCEASGVWMLAAALVAISAYAAGVDPLVAESYIRFDSGHYLSIAQSGYSFNTCARLSENDLVQFCGNAGWMPGYPLLIRLLVALNVSAAAAGLLCSCVFFFGSLVLLRMLLEMAAPGRDHLVSLLAASVFPGGIYFLSVFPISMLLFFSFLTMLLLDRGSYSLASLAAASGALVYATGFLLTGVVVAGVLINPCGGSWPRRLGKAFLFGMLAFAGFCAVLLMHHFVVGHWNAFFLVQAKYGHGIHNPIDTIRAAWADAARESGSEVNFIRELQTLVVAVIVVGTMGSVIARFRQLVRIEWICSVYVLLFWLFPLVMGRGVSPTRPEAMLLPLTVFLARSSRAVQTLIIVLFTFLAFEVDVAFFKSVLI